jgi:hypothetical protein
VWEDRKDGEGWLLEEENTTKNLRTRIRKKKGYTTIGILGLSNIPSNKDIQPLPKKTPRK